MLMFIMELRRETGSVEFDNDSLSIDSAWGNLLQKNKLLTLGTGITETLASRVESSAEEIPDSGVVCTAALCEAALFHKEINEFPFVSALWSQLQIPSSIRSSFRLVSQHRCNIFHATQGRNGHNKLTINSNKHLI